MKTQLPIAFFLLIFSLGASAQPAAVGINPATGLPEAGSPSQPINPATGLPDNGPALHLLPVVAPSSTPPPFIPQTKDSLDEWAGGPSFDLPAPGQNPDFQKILLQATILTQKGRYDEALQHLVWYYTHTETNQAQRGVRVSFALSDWVDLGHHYPEARQSLLEIRDEYWQRLINGDGSPGLFQDVVAINRHLGTEDDSYRLFKSIEPPDPKLAHQCYYWVENLLLQKHEYATCRKYIGDPQADYKRICRQYDQGMWAVRHFTEMRQRVPQPVRPSSLPPIPDPTASMKKFIEDQFVNEVGNLVEILVATGSQSDAENIQKQALTVLDDPRLETAVDDAKAKITKTP